MKGSANMLSPYDNCEMNMESPGVCPICGGPIYSTDKVIVSRLTGEILGCENCTTEKEWVDVA